MSEQKKGFLASLNLPNRLTLMRIVLVPVYLLLLWLSGRGLSPVWAFLVFAAASLTDLLDGKIARKYNLVTTFGKFMDPIADKLLTHTAFIMLTAMGRLACVPCIIFIAREFVVAALREIAADQGIVIAAGMSGKVKTVLQMALVIVLTLNFPALGGFFAVLTTLLVIAAAAMTLYSMCEYVWKNRQVLGGDR